MSECRAVYQARRLGVLEVTEHSAPLLQEAHAMAAKFVLTKSNSDKYYFVLKAAKGETIAQSEMYNSKAAAMNGIKSVKKNAGDAKVDDQTGE